MRLLTCAAALPFLQFQVYKMPLVVRPIEHVDVAQCIALRAASVGSLVIGRPPPYPGYVQAAEASVRNDLDNRPFVHHLKVVDPENERGVMAYGKWEVYPDGRPDLEKLRQPMDQADKEVDQYGLLREAAHEYFCTRNGEKGKRPHFLLALLVTAKQHRRQGAASLIVKWGIEMSEATGLSCYLQASEQGRRLYSHYGFQDIDTVGFDLSKYGLVGVEKMTEMTRKPVSDKAQARADTEVNPIPPFTRAWLNYFTGDRGSRSARTLWVAQLKPISLVAKLHTMRLCGGDDPMSQYD